MVDLEGAFDSVWREAVIVKMFEMGIEGRLLAYVASFLQNRQSRSLVNTHVTDWSSTTIGVPQGSVIAPILFIIFIKDIASNIPKHIKFADDLTIWVRNRDAKVASKELEKQLKKLQDWCNKWRLIINIQKTEVICFSAFNHTDIEVKLGNTTLNQVNVKPCLGVMIDENLAFNLHIKTLKNKAMAAFIGLAASCMSAEE